MGHGRREVGTAEGMLSMHSAKLVQKQFLIPFIERLELYGRHRYSGPWNLSV